VLFIPITRASPATVTASSRPASSAFRPTAHAAQCAVGDLESWSAKWAERRHRGRGQQAQRGSHSCFCQLLPACCAAETACIVTVLAVVEEAAGGGILAEINRPSMQSLRAKFPAPGHTPPRHVIYLLRNYSQSCAHITATSFIITGNCGAAGLELREAGASLSLRQRPALADPSLEK
jgi:hypothetical protein